MRPVELIVTTTMHDIAERLPKIPKWLIETSSAGAVEEAIARAILHAVADQGRLDVVLKAIASIGGPNAGEIAARFKAVQDMHAQK